MQRRSGERDIVSNRKLIQFICFIYTEKMLVVLRDGRKLIGVLRSYDQFGECFVWSLCRVRKQLEWILVFDWTASICKGSMYARLSMLVEGSSRSRVNVGGQHPVINQIQGSFNFKKIAGIAIWIMEDGGT